MTTITQSAVEHFISQTRALCDREPDVDKRWAALPPLLKELLADPQVRDAARSWPVPGVVDGRGGNLLFYEDPDYGFVINGQVHEARAVQGEPSAAHDHGQNYTAYGLLDGHERIMLFQRVDDGARPDLAEVRKTNDYLAGPGDVHLAAPGDIHVEVNVGERTAAVIVRSLRDGGPNNPHGRYDLVTHHYHQSVGPRQIPAEIVPQPHA